MMALCHSDSALFYLLGLVVSQSLGFTLSLETLKELVVVPSDRGGEVTKAARLAAGGDLQVLQGQRHNLSREIIINQNEQSYRFKHARLITFFRFTKYRQIISDHCFQTKKTLEGGTDTISVECIIVIKTALLSKLRKQELWRRGMQITMRFILSKGWGMPSKMVRRSRAAAPRLVL